MTPEGRGEPQPGYRLPDSRLSDRVQYFPESVIREMTRLANRHGAVNLSQGFPDFDPPREIVEAAQTALMEGYNQYATTWGAEVFREAISQSYRRFQGLDVDPERHVVVTCGSTEAMMAVMLSLVNPGEEAIILEPFYENYGPDSIVSGARPRFLRLTWPSFDLEEEALKAAFSPSTKVLLLNTPNNPTGKVFSREELRLIGDLCEDHNAICVTDEIYEHIVYDQRVHVSLSTLGDMWERTITISGLSKTFSVTGWRLGYTVAPKALTDAIKRTHDFLTVGAPHPLQVAGARALSLPDEYFRRLRKDYAERRDLLFTALSSVGFECVRPEGAYYIMADITAFELGSDVEFIQHLVKEVGVAAVPGSSFFSEPSEGASLVRFAFPKKLDTLREAVKRMDALRARL